MKRLAEFEKELSSLEQKRAKIHGKIKHRKDLIQFKDNRKIKSERKRFINNVQIARVPMMKAEPKIFPFDDIKEREIAVKKKKLKREDVDNWTTIFHCLDIPEMAQLIMQHLGPYELFMCTLVSKPFAVITTNCFIELAPSYLIRYGEDLESSSKVIPKFQNDKALMCSIVTAYRQDTKKVAIGKLLRLFSQFFRTYRMYGVASDIIHNTVHHIDYTFIRDTEYSLTKKIPVRARDCNLFVSSQYENVLESFKARWQEEFECFGESEMENNRIKHFNYNELCALEIQPITGIFVPKQTIMVKGNSILRVKNDKWSDRYDFISISPPMVKDKVVNCAPFFDYYEMRTKLQSSLSLSPQILRDNIKVVSDLLTQ